jgi:hypothetical protein
MLKLLVEFSAAWWHDHYGLVAEERDWTDPEHRIRKDMERQRLLYERFGHAGLGCRDPRPAPGLASRPIDVSYLFGVRFECRGRSGVWPVPLNLNEEAAARLEPIRDIAGTPLAQDFLRQMAYLEEHYGWRWPAGQTQGISGVLNTILDIRGYAFLADLAANPPLAHHLLYVVTETIIHYRNWQYAISGGRPGDGWSSGNCSDTMISPQMYLDFVFPCDEWLAAPYRHLGIHRDDRILSYLPAYLRHPKLSGVEIGWDTPLAAVRKILPAGRYHINLRCDPAWVTRATPTEINDQMQTWMEEAGEPLSRFGVICQELDPEAPDRNVEALLEHGVVGYVPPA